MNVQNPSAQELQLFDNYGLWHVPFWHKPWFIIVVTLSALILISLLLFLLFKFKPIKKKRLTRWQQTMHDLLHLQKGELHNIAQSSAFYASLTAIMKRYMSDLYAQDVKSYTDQQMLDYIASLDLFDAQKASLGQIFSAGELIKFANQDALEQQMQDDITFSISFVRSTKKNKDKKGE